MLRKMKNDKIIVPVELEDKSYPVSVEKSLILFKRVFSQKRKMLKIRFYHVKRNKRSKLERSIS